MAGPAAPIDLWQSSSLSSPWRMGATPGSGLVELTAASATAIAAAMVSGGTFSGRRDANGNTLTVTPLAAGATFNSGTISLAADNRYGYLNVEAYADQAGVLFVEKSADAATWYPCAGLAGIAVAAGNTVTIKVPLVTLFYRVRYTNGATPNTVFGIFYNVQLA